MPGLLTAGRILEQSGVQKRNKTQKIKEKPIKNTGKSCGILTQRGIVFIIKMLLERRQRRQCKKQGDTDEIKRLLP
ncbi:hypothetical protein [uncultured Allofournierella sp.]|uniref:hypothetical protein n=1 Tax=uncultured Allofournierella sp. TaxID=1940258 RepID=UPI003750C925